MNPDNELLRRFADEGSQEAFAELVQLKVDLVFAAALRQTGGDAHLAQDVTQGVFATLAGRASSLSRHAVLTGWLFTTTRFLAISAMRQQRRWQRREQDATTMNAIEREADPAWDQLRPVIDEAMHELGEKDRAALLLRFFEGRSLAEVGAAIGLAENSARMRVERALEKLRARLERRGITSTAAALGLTLAAQPATSAPAGLAAVAASAALASATLGTGLGTTLAIMSTSKFVIAAAALLAIGALGGYLGAQSQAGAASLAAVTTAGENRSALAPRREESQRVPEAFAFAAVRPPENRAAGGSAALDSLRVLLDLHRRKLVTSVVHMVTATPSGVRLTAEFAELFGLTTGERDALQRNVDAVREHMAELARGNTSVVRAPNGDVTLEVKAFPEAGGAAYDAMLKSFADTLGPERYNAFLALEGEELERELGRFGVSHSSITFSRETSGDGELLYRIRSRSNITPEDSANYVSDRLNYERFVQEAGKFIELLPPDFLPPR